MSTPISNLAPGLNSNPANINLSNSGLSINGNSSAPVGSVLAGQSQNQGLKGSVSGLTGTAGNIAGNVGNFFSNLWNGTSGGYTPMAGFGSSQTTSPSTPPPPPPTQNSPVTPIVPTAPVAPAPAQNLGYGNSGNSSQTPNTPVNGVGTSIFPGVASSLANTSPYGATQTAVNTSNNVGTGTPQDQQGQNYQNNINQGAAVSGNIAQNQTPAVQGAYQNLQNFNQSNPLLQSAQASLPMAALISSGRGQILGNQLSGEQQGLANTYNAAVTGEGQQLTGANQQIGAGVQGQQNQLSGAQQAGNISNAAQSNQIGAQTSALQAVQPQLGAYGQTYYNPLQAGQTQGGVNGITGPAASGVVAGQQQAGQTYTQNNAILGKVSAQLPALSQLIQSSGYNANPATYINQLQQWGAGTLSNSSIPEVQGSLNDIVASLSQVLGVPSSGASDFRTQFAAQIVNGLQSGQSIQDALQFAVTQATAGNQGYLQGATGQTGTQSGSQGGTMSAGGYNFVQQNGKWVPAS